MQITKQEDIEILTHAMSRYIDDIRNDLEARFTVVPEHTFKDDLKISERILKRLRKEIKSRAS